MRHKRIALVAALVLAWPAVAHADGDPASDVLTRQDGFYPYAPRPSANLKRALDQLLATVRAAGYPMKVALIGSTSDLGAVSQLFNHSNEYANLLAQELPANRHGPKLEGQHILVVMPAGF